jgi:spoIIIJ-associated protein
VVEEGVEFSGRTIEEATVQAETYFGGSRADLQIEVITQGRSGVFGIGAEPARIRVRPPATTAQPEPAVEAEATRTPERATVDVDDPQVQTDALADSIDEPDESDAVAPKPRRETATASADLPGDAREVLDGLLRSMGFDAVVSVRSTENPVILSVSGQNLGVLIGRRGDNLASLQFMVNLILSKGRRQWPRVVIDVENYRARREESLRSLADRIAYRVGRHGRPFTLEAMPASDRRVIHLALRERNDVETYSIGEGVSRRVVIAPIRSGGRNEDSDE